ncbi:MAG TPA: glycosyltransferase [Planctomycetota bacterium]|jgi:glycosyltransferase involved in cell wall biosynthesis
MNVLIVCTAFLPNVEYGGPVTAAMDHARELQKRGHHVTVISSNVLAFRPPAWIAETTNVVDGVTVRYFPSSYVVPHFSLVRSPDLVTWLHANVRNFDAVHIHFAREWIPTLAARCALHAEVPVFLQPHGMLNRRSLIKRAVDQMVLQNILRSAAAVLVLQDHERQVIQTIAPGTRTVELGNGITLHPDMPQWHRIYPPVVLFLSRLHPRKRVLDFIEMASLLHVKHPELTFRVVGPDGGDLQVARAKAAALGLSACLYFEGPVNHSAALQEMARASVYVLPSVDEPFPISVLEALAVGVPTVVTTSLHIKDLLERHSAAEIVDPGPMNLAEAVTRLLAHPAEAQQRSTAGQRLVAERLSLTNVVDRLEELYASHECRSTIAN